METNKKPSTENDLSGNQYGENMLTITLASKQMQNQSEQFFVFVIGAVLAIVCHAVASTWAVGLHFYTPFLVALTFLGAGLKNFFIHEDGFYLHSKGSKEIKEYEDKRSKHLYNNFFVAFVNILMALIIVGFGSSSLTNTFSLEGLALIVVSIFLFGSSQPLAQEGWRKVLPMK